MIIKATNLIENLKESFLLGGSILLLDELVKMKKEYDDNKNKTTLSIKIDPDDDFSVKGKYYGEVVVDINETYHDALIRYINALNIDVKNNSKAKNFINTIKSPDFCDELNNYGSISAGGNQTIDVEIIKNKSFIIFGDLEIDLSQ